MHSTLPHFCKTRERLNLFGVPRAHISVVTRSMEIMLQDTMNNTGATRPGQPDQ